MQNLFYQPGVSSGVNYLDPDESRHCITVLRKNIGDVIHITDGLGNIVEANITRADSKKCVFTVQRTTTIPARAYSFHLAVAPTKHADRMEWMVEKCMEIGIDEISFIQTVHSERMKINTARIEKIVTSAMKQALQPYRPVVRAVLSLTDCLRNDKADQKFIAHANTSTPHLADVAQPGKSCTLTIGPEGDFTTDELYMARDYGFRHVTLGNSRLRTETACLAGCLALSLINRHLQ